VGRVGDRSTTTAAGAIGGEVVLVRHHGHAVQHRLRDQRTIERVFERAGQCGGRLPVDKTDRQRYETLCVEHGYKILGDRRDAGKLADAEFGCDLPRGNRADEHGIAGVTDRGAGRA
jgi:hypothetical protein